MGASAALLGWEIRHHDLLHGDVCLQRRAVSDSTPTLPAWRLRHVRTDWLHTSTTDTVTGKENVFWWFL